MSYASFSVVFGEQQRLPPWKLGGSVKIQPSAAKWNILGTNDASFNNGTGIADAAITPAKLLAGTGTSWAWQSWTPTYTVLTVGNGTHNSKYIQIGKTVIARLAFTLGSTSAMGAGVPTFTLPVTSASYTTSQPAIGFGNAVKNVTSEYPCLMELPSITTGSILLQNAAGTYVVAAAFSSIAPFTWAANDSISAVLVYEAAQI